MKVSEAPEDHIDAWAGGNAGTETLNTDAMNQQAALAGRGLPDAAKQREFTGGGGLGLPEGLRRGICGPFTGGHTRRDHLR